MAKRKLPPLKANNAATPASRRAVVVQSAEPVKRRPLSLRNAIEDAILASPVHAGPAATAPVSEGEFAPIVARGLGPVVDGGMPAGLAAKPAMPADLRAEDFDFQSAEIWDVYQKALIAQRRGDLDAARKGYLTVLSRKPGDFDVMHMMGVLETQARNYAMAYKLLSDAMRIDDGGPAIHNNLAIVLCATGRHAEGMAEFRRALDIDPEFADAHANFGRALCDTGRAPESLPYFSRACELEPKSADIHFQRATVLDALKLRDEALAAYDQVLKINPSYAEAHCKRGHLFAQQKRFDEALSSYERAIGCNPQYAEAHCNRGNVLRLTGFHAEGLVAVDRALALQREVAPAHRIRGVILLALQRNEEALAAFDEAIRLRAGYLDALNDRGSALRALSRYDEAIAAHNQALAIAPNAPGVLVNRGVAYLDSYRVEEGFRDLQRAVELAPQSAEFWNLHGNALQALNRHDEALLSYGRSLQLQPGFAQPEFNISMCRLVRGDFRGGWPPYERRWETGQKLGWMQFRRPMWTGQSFEGRLLAWGEQGVGDQIFHLSMLDSLRERAPNLLVALAPRLLALAQRSFPDLGGIAGADRHCQALATLAGAGRKTWRAYLSTTAQAGGKTVHARERIGKGPWHNFEGRLIARNVEELHSINGINRMTALTERGGIVNGRADAPNRHDILTGSTPEGRALENGKDTTCSNWTKSGAGAALVGHHDRWGLRDDEPSRSWNSSHPSRGCSQDNLKASGGDGLFCCFAVR